MMSWKIKIESDTEKYGILSDIKKISIFSFWQKKKLVCINEIIRKPGGYQLEP